MAHFIEKAGWFIEKNARLIEKNARLIEKTPRLMNFTAGKTQITVWNLTFPLNFIPEPAGLQEKQGGIMKFPAWFILEPAILMKFPARFIAESTRLMKFIQKNHESPWRSYSLEWIFTFSSALFIKSGGKSITWRGSGLFSR